MKTVFILLVAFFGLALLVFLSRDMAADFIDHVQCVKDHTIITCHLEEP